MTRIDIAQVEEALKTTNKVYGGKCLNEHAALNILLHTAMLLKSKVDAIDCQVTYYKGRYLNSFFIKIKGDFSLFAIDIDVDNRITKFDYHTDSFLQWLNGVDKEEDEMNDEYRPLLDILKYMKSGDVLERKSDGQGIVLDGAVFSWYNIEEDKRTGTIALTTALLDTKFRVLPHYVGWQEAFEAYENGYTIGCEYEKEIVWFNRDITTLDESSILADKQLDGLITTKWIIK